jgi:hypothetical protein
MKAFFSDSFKNLHFKNKLIEPPTAFHPWKFKYQFDRNNQHVTLFILRFLIIHYTLFYSYLHMLIVSFPIRGGQPLARCFDFFNLSL